jgi:hypothetical protein
MQVVEEIPVALVVELASTVQRFPSDTRERIICGLPVPLVSVDAQTASAPAKVSLALDRFGLK